MYFRAIGCDGQRMLLRRLLHAIALAIATLFVVLRTMLQNPEKYGRKNEDSLLGPRR